MKKKVPVALIAAALVTVLCATLPCEEKNVSVLNFVNDTGDSVNDTLAGTTQDIIKSGIKYIGSFRVLATPSFAVDTDAKSLKEYAELTGSEFIIFGSIADSGKGTPQLCGNIYSRADDSIVAKKATLEDALDIFSVSDSMSLVILSELHKTRIAYGSISLKTGGYAGEFAVYVNDVLAGTNKTSIQNIPDGYKNVRVVAKMPKGVEKTVFSDRVLVRANVVTAIAVAFQEAAKKIAAGKGALTITSTPPGMLVSVDGAEPAETPFTLEVEPGAHKFEPIECAIDGLEFAGQPIQWITVREGDEAVLPLKPDPVMGAVDLSLVPNDYRVFIGDREITQTADGLAECQVGVNVLSFMKNDEVVYTTTAIVLPSAPFAMIWGVHSGIPIRAERHDIDFRRGSKSWDDIKPVYTADFAQPFLSIRDYGVKTVKIATDGTYFFWRADFEKKNPITAVPAWRGTPVTLQLRVPNIEQYVNLNIDLYGGAGIQAGTNTYNTHTRTTTTMPSKCARLIDGNSATGRIPISEILKFADGIYYVELEVALSDRSAATNTRIGWIDFSTLEQ